MEGVKVEASDVLPLLFGGQAMCGLSRTSKNSLLILRESECTTAPVLHDLFRHITFLKECQRSSPRCIRQGALEPTLTVTALVVAILPHLARYEAMPRDPPILRARQQGEPGRRSRSVP